MFDRRRRQGVYAGFIAAAAAIPLLLPSQPASAQVGSSPAGEAYFGTGEQVRVSGTRLLKDDKPWVPHGFVQIAFVKPPTVPVGGAVAPFFAVAADDYTPLEYLEMRIAGADSVRIQVAQPGLNPTSGKFSAAFRQKVISAIMAARAVGLVVIVSMQDEPQTGATKTAMLPDEETRNAWHQIAPVFGQDRGVVLELYNEPEPAASAADWPAWKAAMEKTIAAIRDDGAHNVVVADGLDFAESLQGAPLLADPDDQVAYAVHPYAHAETDQTAARWDATFGDFAGHRAPVIVTEWGIGYFCNDRTPDATKSFLQYLDRRGIGLQAVTWDWQPANFGSAIYDFPDLRLSRFTGPDGLLACHEAAVPGKPGEETAVIPTGDGPGAMIETWYETGTPPGSVE